METIDAAKLRSEFLQVLRSRRSSEVTLSVELGKPVADPMYQQTPRPSFSEAMESCPKADIPNLKDLLKEENVHLITEAGEQGRLPVLIVSINECNHQRKPAVVFLHSTHKCKEWLRPLLEAYASRGYIAIAIDSRYHGERASSMTTYRDALVSSWKQGDTMPFIFDTVWDLIKLADYLTQREDIDPSKIGITGESLGGEKDPRCPIEGLEIPKSRACKAYEDAHCPDNFKVITQPGIGHEMTPLMVKEASD